MKNAQSKIKPIKTGKKIGTTYCLGCKDYSDNLNPQKIKMANKVLREKSNCVVCRCSKSRFSKQKHNNNNKLQRQHTNCVVCRYSKSRFSKQKHNNNNKLQRQHKSSNGFFKLQEHVYVL